MAAKFARIKAVWIIEDSYSPKIIVFLFKLLARFTNCKVIYISKKVFNFYIKNSKIKKENLYEIMSPTDTKFFKKKFVKKKNNEIIISTISNITKVKGVEIFLESACKVLKKNPKGKFYFVGGSVKNQDNYAKKPTIYSNMDKKIIKKLFLKVCV